MIDDKLTASQDDSLPNNDLQPASPSEPTPEPDTYIEPNPPALAPAPSAQPVVQMRRDTVNYFIVAAVFMALGLLLGLNLNSSDSLTAGEVREIVREVVQANAVTSAQTVDFMEDDDPFLGPEDAPVVIVEFSDFLCPYCGRHEQQTFPRIMEDYDGLVRYVYRDFPGVGGQNAVDSAIAAECANDQGKFWEYHNLLFGNQSALGVELDALNATLISYAEQLELDIEAFTTCIASNEHIADIIQDSSDAQTRGARGTPAFFINGTFVSGAQAYEVFAGIINDKLEEQGIEPPTINSGA
ncbi:MAG: hypothetical protein OHK0046_14340 [Anaerolineae bacterium]